MKAIWVGALLRAGSLLPKCSVTFGVPSALGEGAGNVLAQHPQRTAEALEIYSQALSLDPLQEAVAAGQATLLENQERWEEAAAAYDHAIGLDGNRADLWEGRARCLIQIPKRLEEAIECYREAIAIDPQSYSAHADAGWVLNELKRFPEAIAEFETATEINPSLPLVAVWMR